MRIKKARRTTGIGRSKLHELIADGEVEIVKVGSMILVPVADLQKFVDGGASHRSAPHQLRRYKAPGGEGRRIDILSMRPTWTCWSRD